MDNDALTVNVDDAAPAAAPKHAVGRASAVGPAERLEMRMAHLSEGVTHGQLVKRFGRSGTTVSAILKGDEFDALKRKITVDVAKQTLRELKKRAKQVLGLWLLAIEVAAKRGNSKPAQDWLERAGAIQPSGEVPGSGWTVNVNVAAGTPPPFFPTQAQVDAGAPKTKEPVIDV